MFSVLVRYFRREFQFRERNEIEIPDFFNLKFQHFKFFIKKTSK